MFEEMKETKSVKRLMELSRSYTQAVDLVATNEELNGKMHVLMTARDVNVPFKKLKQSEVNALGNQLLPTYYLPLTLGRREEKLTLTHNRRSGEQTLRVADDGTVNVMFFKMKVHDLLDTELVIKSEDGEILFDTTNPENLRAVFEQSGYTFDVE